MELNSLLTCRQDSREYQRFKSFNGLLLEQVNELTNRLQLGQSVWLNQCDYKAVRFSS